jgi:chromate transporter
VPNDISPAFSVFSAFLRLGCTSFGGPIAHVGYFRTEFVVRRKWLDDDAFAELLAISQFLPGPASSQLGFGIGLLRAGPLGALAAFIGFTLPSAVALFALAMLATSSGANGGAWGTTIVHALKLVAVVVVADGVWRMGRQLTPDMPRLLIATAAGMLVIVASQASAQMMAIVVGAIAGGLLLRSPSPARGPRLAVGYGTRTAFVAIAFAAALIMFAFVVPLAAPSLPGLGAVFTRAGALVFGGGHVVLPLLEESVVTTGGMSHDAFLAGYGAAQAVPGPMFSLAAYLGAVIPTGAPAVVGALVALLALFIPGFLLLVAALPFWGRITAAPRAVHAVAGVNAAVVGILAAALYDPVITSGIASVADVAIVVGALVIQRRSPRPTIWVVAFCLAASSLLP